MLNKIKIEDIKQIALDAGDAIMKIYENDFNVEYKDDNSPLTQADLKANQIICDKLKKLYPNIPIMSEENKQINYDIRKDWEYYWCIDPIDGTKEFINKNGEFTVNIALINKTVPVLGVVYAPALNDMYYAKKDDGAFKNGLKLPILRDDNKYIIVASKSHMSDETKKLIDDIKTLKTKELISMGSSLKLCLVAEGVADIYPRLAPTMEWDTAAAHIIVLESGSNILQYESYNSVVYNKENLHNPYFIVQSSLESSLLKIVQKNYINLVSSATTGLVLLLESLKLKNCNIAIPINICINVPMAIQYSNNNPYFIDNDLETLGISIKELNNNKEHIDAVIVPHAYGNTCNIVEIIDFCNDNNIIVIEDIAVALGAKFGNNYVGSFADFTVVSFGSGKVISVGHGGAVLSNRIDIYNNITLLNSKLSIFTEEDEKKIYTFDRLLTDLYNKTSCGDKIYLYKDKIQTEINSLKECFLKSFDYKYYQSILLKLKELDKLIILRKKNAKYLDTKFDKNTNAIVISKNKYDSVYWRYNIFLKENRNELLYYLIKKGYKVSSWYFSIDLLFKDKNDLTYKRDISDYIMQHIFNIWVNEEIDKAYLDEISEEILLFLEEKDEQI